MNKIICRCLGEYGKWRRYLINLRKLGYMTAFVLTGENLTKRYLPLGAPSSPWLSNLVFQNVDFQILNLLKDKKFNIQDMQMI